MQFISNESFIKVLIFLLAFCGFWVAKHIRDHKIKNTPLVCMVGFDCHAVVHSDYSKFFKIPVEMLGLLYYAFIASAYLLFFLVPNLLSPGYNYILNILVFFTSIGAFLFSVYLIAIQTFVLKKGCSWCIVSALICLGIFVLTVFNLG